MIPFQKRVSVFILTLALFACDGVKKPSIIFAVFAIWIVAIHAKIGVPPLARPPESRMGFRDGLKARPTHGRNIRWNLFRHFHCHGSVFGFVGTSHDQLTADRGRFSRSARNDARNSSAICNAFADDVNADAH
jgi:hypothetical protein